ncbi:MAG: S-layer homology domain-containing protein [Cyanobacteria bacterium J06638_20]
MIAKRLVGWCGIVLAATIPLAACTGGNLEQSLAPDPQLQAGEATGGLTVTASLPPDFPAEIPPYPGAALQAVTSEASGTEGATQVVTRWATRDSQEEVMQFYQAAFEQQSWELVSEDDTRLVARQDDLNVQFELLPSAPDAEAPEASPDAAQDEDTAQPADGAQPEGAAIAEFTLSYTRGTAEQDENPTATDASPTTDETLTDEWANRPSAAASPTPSRPPRPIGTAVSFSDLDDAPADFQPYIADLAALGILNGTQQGTFQPNETVTRRAYARWLLETNNQLFSDQPQKQIRRAIASDSPTFQDVPSSDPDFGIIQGLANAGLIPSPLSGNSTVVRFRPDAPLTREELILWKVPLDTRQPLPDVTLQALQDTWGFQDAGQIDPRAQRAVLADFQNGDRSNIRRAFGFTTLFQPDRPVTRAEAVAVLWQFGTEGDGMTAREATNSDAQPQ